MNYKLFLKKELENIRESITVSNPEIDKHNRETTKRVAAGIVKKAYEDVKKGKPEIDDETKKKIAGLERTLQGKLKQSKIDVAKSGKQAKDAISKIGKDPHIKKQQADLKKVTGQMVKDKQRERMLNNIRLGMLIATPIIVLASAMGLTYWQSYKRLKKSCKKKFPNNPKEYRFCMKGGNKKLKDARNQGKFKSKTRGK